jgi:hypothetical protein
LAAMAGGFVVFIEEPLLVLLGIGRLIGGVAVRRTEGLIGGLFGQEGLCRRLGILRKV